MTCASWRFPRGKECFSLDELSGRPAVIGFAARHVESVPRAYVRLLGRCCRNTACTTCGDPMKHAFALLCSALLTVSIAGFINPAHADHGTVIDDENYVCDTTVDHATFEGNVVVPDGATCVITNSTIEGNVRTWGAGEPEMVRLIDTDVRHNIHLRNVTGRVTIGASGCRIDPEVGNNLMVRNSNNVAICEMSIANNLVLRNNTGRLMARDNLVCNNIRIVRNDLVGLRVLRNRYVVNFTVSSNTVDRTNRVEGNAEEPGNPGTCKRTVRGAIG